VPVLKPPTDKPSLLSLALSPGPLLLLLYTPTLLPLDT
jgi:hypothetical protein